MTMSEFERLAAKIDGIKDHLGDKLAALHADLEVLKAQRSSGEKDLLALRAHVDEEVGELKGRVGAVERKQNDAAVWRAWMMGAGAALGVAGSKALDWLLGRQ